VELAALEAKALFVRAESAKVLGSLGDNIIEEVEVDATGLGLDSPYVADVALWVNGELRAFPARVELVVVALTTRDSSGEPEVEVDCIKLAKNADGRGLLYTNPS